MIASVGISFLQQIEATTGQKITFLTALCVAPHGTENARQQGGSFLDTDHAMCQERTVVSSNVGSYHLILVCNHEK